MNQSSSHDEYRVKDVGGGRLEAEELELCIDTFGTDVYRFCWSLCQNKLNIEKTSKAHCSFEVFYGYYF